MARDARLALPQHLDEIAHAELAARTDRHQPQTGRLGDGTQGGENLIHAELYKHILILRRNGKSPAGRKTADLPAPEAAEDEDAADRERERADDDPEQGAG